MQCLVKHRIPFPESGRWVRDREGLKRGTSDEKERQRICDDEREDTGEGVRD